MLKFPSDKIRKTAQRVRNNAKLIPNIDYKSVMKYALETSRSAQIATDAGELNLTNYHSLDTKQLKVLIYGNVNLNLLDGSAVWATSVARMLSVGENIQTDLLLKTHIHNDRLLKPLYDLDNVQIIDPFADKHREQLGAARWYKRKDISPGYAPTVIQHCFNEKDYDFCIVRGYPVIKALLKHPHLMKKMWVYLTDFPHTMEEFSVQEFEDLQSVLLHCNRFLCQTEEMRAFLIELFPFAKDKVYVLNPMIPLNEELNPTFKISNQPSLVYAGKFADLWMSQELLELFPAIRQRLPKITFNIAGDKFNDSKVNENFKEDVTRLLETTTGVNWIGGVSREESQKLILESDIGISYRSHELDDSLELSTKVLEYAILGKPVIFNKSDMHTRLFGEDYPLYANSDEEVVEKIVLAVENPEVYEMAAKRMFEVAKRFTFESMYLQLSDKLWNEKKIPPFYMTPREVREQIRFYKSRLAVLSQEYLFLINRLGNDESKIEIDEAIMNAAHKVENSESYEDLDMYMKDVIFLSEEVSRLTKALREKHMTDGTGESHE